MIGWQWRQLDHMQIICTSLQTGNHASTSSINFLQAGCSSWCPTNGVKALKATTKSISKHTYNTTINIPIWPLSTWTWIGWLAYWLSSFTSPKEDLSRKTGINIFTGQTPFLSPKQQHWKHWRKLKALIQTSDIYPLASSFPHLPLHFLYTGQWYKICYDICLSLLISTAGSATLKVSNAGKLTVMFARGDATNLHLTKENNADGL